MTPINPAKVVKCAMRIPALRSRWRRQQGQEIVEFGLSLFLFVPLLLGTFVTGMNLVKSIQAQHVVRDLDNMYIHGGDFSSNSYQQLAKRVATGLNLQFPAFTSGVNNIQSNTGSSGDGIIWVSQVMRIGSTTDPNCVAVGAANCTNANKYVFLQRIVFGNSTLTSQQNSFIGDVNASAVIDSSGTVSNYIKDANAQVSTAGQTALTAAFGDTSTGVAQTALTDGQVLYIVEGYFQTPTLGLGTYTSKGVYARYFF